MFPVVFHLMSRPAEVLQRGPRGSWCGRPTHADQLLTSLKGSEWSAPSLRSSWTILKAQHSLPNSSDYLGRKKSTPRFHSILLREGVLTNTRHRRKASPVLDRAERHCADIVSDAILSARWAAAVCASPQIHPASFLLIRIFGWAAPLSTPVSSGGPGNWFHMQLKLPQYPLRHALRFYNRSGCRLQSPKHSSHVCLFGASPFATHQQHVVSVRAKQARLQLECATSTPPRLISGSAQTHLVLFHLWFCLQSATGPKIWALSPFNTIIGPFDHFSNFWTFFCLDRPRHPFD